MITEQLNGLAKYTRNSDGGSHVKDIEVGEVHIFRDEGDGRHPHARYAGQDRVNMTVGVRVSYDDTNTFDGSLNHRDCRKKLECLVTEEGGIMKFIGFDDVYSIGYLLNPVGEDF